MDTKTIIVSNILQERLLSLKPNTGVVVGWYGEEGVFCVGCCAEPDPIPSGLQAVGAFCISDDTPSEKEAVSMCQEVLGQQWECCPEEDYAVVLHLQTLENTLKRCVSAVGYSLEYGTIHSASLELHDEQDIYEQHVLLRAKGSVALRFQQGQDDEAISESSEKLRTLFTNGTVAFHLKDSSVLLGHDKADSLTVSDLLQALESGKSKSKPPKTKKRLAEKDALNFVLYLQSTNLSKEENGNHSPLIKYQRNNFHSVSIPLTFDVVAMQPLDASASDAYHALTAALTNQLDSFIACILRFRNKLKYDIPEPLTFWPQNLGFPISFSYPKTLDDTQLVSLRKELHQVLFLNTDRPALKKLNRFEFSDDLAKIPYLRNTHQGIVKDLSGQGFKQAIVHGTYTYHHYMQDRIDDNGWGCAYRSLQTIVSWFRHQGYTDKPVPTHEDIQQALVDIGDKPSSFVGSSKWIGSQEVSFCLDHLIGVTSKIMFVSSGADLSSKGRELLNHFESQGTPIMIGGGVLAHTIIGVKYNDLTGDIGYLIVDPHYTGGEDLHTIQNKGWCGWKGADFWDKAAFYNLCLPQRPITL